MVPTCFYPPLPRQVDVTDTVYTERQVQQLQQQQSALLYEILPQQVIEHLLMQKTIAVAGALLSASGLLAGVVMGLGIGVVGLGLAIQSHAASCKRLSRWHEVLCAPFSAQTRGGAWRWCRHGIGL